MKLYAIVEINDEDYEGDFEEWYIRGDDLDIRYVEDDVYMHYKSIVDDMLKLKPLPQRLYYSDVNNDYRRYVDGWDDCLNAILGEE